MEDHSHAPKEKVTDKQEEVIIKILKQENWKHLLDYSYDKPFFVYCTWRFDYKMQKLEYQLANWWKDSEETA